MAPGPGNQNSFCSIMESKMSRLALLLNDQRKAWESEIDLESKHLLFLESQLNTLLQIKGNLFEMVKPSLSMKRSSIGKGEISNSKGSINPKSTKSRLTEKPSLNYSGNIKDLLYSMRGTVLKKKVPAASTVPHTTTSSSMKKQPLRFPTQVDNRVSLDKDSHINMVEPSSRTKISINLNTKNYFAEPHSSKNSPYPTALRFDSQLFENTDTSNENAMKHEAPARSFRDTSLNLVHKYPTATEGPSTTRQPATRPNLKHSVPSEIREDHPEESSKSNINNLSKQSKHEALASPCAELLPSNKKVTSSANSDQSIPQCNIL